MPANFRFTDATNNDPATVYIYDDIGPDWAGMIGAQTVVSAIEGLGTKPLDVRINSGGGDVFEGLGIYNALLRHRGKITTHVDSLAASIASVIAMAGEEILMAENAMMMIHNAWTILAGNSAELRKTADLLDQIDGTLVETYRARTDQSVEDIQQWMAAETWMTAAQAVERGFATAIGQPLRGVSAHVREGRYRNTPKQFLPRSKASSSDDTNSQPSQPQQGSRRLDAARISIAAARRRFDSRL